jgi:hypothetical protein
MLTQGHQDPSEPVYGPGRPRYKATTEATTEATIEATTARGNWVGPIWDHGDHGSPHF